MGPFAIVGLAFVAVVSAHEPAATPSATPQAAAPATLPAPQDPPLQAALGQGRSAEDQARYADAVRHYRKAAALGSGMAARRLGEIYLAGAPGVDRDMAEAMRWNRQAELRGEVLAQAVRLRLP